MAKTQKIKTEKVEDVLEFAEGFTYVKENEIWAIEYRPGDQFMIVFAREQQFKVKPDKLVILEGKDNE